MICRLLKNKYILNLIIAMFILLLLNLMNFYQSMSPSWVGPYLSAANNFSWSDFSLFVNLQEIKEFSELSNSDRFDYNFSSNNDLVLYDYLAKGFTLIVVFAKIVFFWSGDLTALQYLQYVVHILISLIILNAFKAKRQKIIFFTLYAINPLILYIANFPFYYFWQAIPSFIFIYWYLDSARFKGFIYIASIVFSLVYLTRPTTLLIIILFYILYAYKGRVKESILGFCVFISLLSFAPGTSIGPWHSMYIGIGAYDNEFNIKLDDESGYSFYKAKTGKSVGSGNIMNKDIKNDYYNKLKVRILEVSKDKPFMLLRNAFYNTIQSYGFGFSKKLNDKFGHKFLYLSLALGSVMIVLLLFTQQYILFFAIGLSSGAYSLYYPPIVNYMFGSYILIVVAFIGIVDYFFDKKISFKA
jgi:hypothetical protein